MADVDPAMQIARDMRALPEETRKALRPKLRSAGQVIAQDAKGRSSWSSRIPGSIKVTTSFRENRENVKVTAGSNAAPHARAYEDVTGPDDFPHPVYGHRDRFVTAAARPFLLPAAEAHEGEATDLVLAALSDAASAIGFS